MCYINHDILVTMVTKRTRWPPLFLLKFMSGTLKESLYQIWGKFMAWKFKSHSSNGGQVKITGNSSDCIHWLCPDSNRVHAALSNQNSRTIFYFPRTENYWCWLSHIIRLNTHLQHTPQILHEAGHPTQSQSLKMRQQPLTREGTLGKIVN